MTVKGIGQGSPYDQIKIQQDRELKNQPREDVKNSTSPDGDGVSVSPEARLRSSALKAATNAPDVRADKVARLKAMVQDGTYAVDGRSLARDIVGQELDLFK